jgi:hypothetical protein
MSASSALWFVPQLSEVVVISMMVVAFAMKVIMPCMKYESFDPRICSTTSENVMDTIKDRMWKSSSQTHRMGGKISPHGLVIGKWFIALVKECDIGNWRKKEYSFEIKILTIRSFVPQKNGEAGDHDASDDETEQKIPILTATSAELHPKWEKYDMVFHGKSNASQDEVADSIILKATLSLKNANPFGFVALLTGKPGTGKSFIAQILANKLNAVLCSDYDPCQIGHSITEVYYAVNPTQKKPLVLLIDEVDKKVEFPEKPPKNDWLKSDVRDKSSWNSWMDYVSTLNNLFVVLTTNRSREELDAMDSSYFRDGRVHETFELVYHVAEHFMRQRFHNADAVAIDMF